MKLDMARNGNGGFKRLDFCRQILLLLLNIHMRIRVCSVPSSCLHVLLTVGKVIQTNFLTANRHST